MPPQLPESALPAVLQAVTDSREVADPQELRFRQLRARVLERERLLVKNFSSAGALEAYVNAHKQSDVVKRKIRSAVAAMESSEAGQGVENRDTRDDTAYIGAYQKLVHKSVVLVSDIFREIPQLATLCELQWFLDLFQEKISESKKLSKDQEELLTALDSQSQARLAFLKSRWGNIVGSQFEIEALPKLQELEPWKAPVPLRPYWSWSLAGAEARRMGHRTASGPDGDGGANGNDTRKVDAVTEGNGDSSEPDSGSAPAGQALGCELSDLLALAGGQELKQPGADGTRYTFPGKLYEPEDVFYDYAMILPVEERGPCAKEKRCDPCVAEGEGVKPRSIEAAQVLVGKVESALQFLKDVGLASALGFRNGGQNLVVDDIEALLAEVLQVSDADDPSFVRKLIARLRERAGLLRLVSRTEMFPWEGKNPKDYLPALDAAVNNFPPLELKPTDLPTKLDRLMDPATQQGYTTLHFPSINKGYLYHSQNSPDTWRDNLNGHINVPDASGPGFQTVIFQWWLDQQQTNDLRNYVRYLGDSSRDLIDPKSSGFYTLLNDLVKSATDMRDVVGGLSGPYAQFKTDFERLASGIINRVTLSVAELLDEIANQLPVPKGTLEEGCKRLALAVIFRQRWHPEGYVLGKLVGYKTLLPNQQETVRRRTFVKTSRELSTAQEFTAARQEDYTHSSKETRDVVREGSQKFGLSASASGKFDFLIASGNYNLTSNYELSQLSRVSQNTVAESAAKSSSSFNEKREVKVRELVETEDVQEVTSQIQNSNQEITANYFYYQLLRQYFVTIELSDLRPVLLRARDVPSPAEVDEYFVSRYAHVLIHQLPLQLSVDAQESADKLPSLARALLRLRSDFEEKAAELEVFRRESLTAGAPPEEMTRWREEYRSKERTVAEARRALIDSEEEYARARMRMDRVLAHLRDNIRYYMQFIWESSPKVDQDSILQCETFCGEPLPKVTRGLIRQGYFGSEEVFDYTGRSLALLDLMLEYLRPGSEILSSLSEDEFRQSALYHYLQRFYQDPDTRDTMIASLIREKVRNLAFVTDPASSDTALDARRVQVAQDALVVEAMPGKVPLLEGFQMAHRMLDVQRACLENAHLGARIEDRPWKDKGEDSYAVRRYDGAVPPSREVKET